MIKKCKVDHAVGDSDHRHAESFIKGQKAFFFIYIHGGADHGGIGFLTVEVFCLHSGSEKLIEAITHKGLVMISQITPAVMLLSKLARQELYEVCF